MREIFVTEIVKEALGPRGGAFEILDDNPLSEYITGVLSPTTITFFLVLFLLFGVAHLL